jgi:hypothetical protein
VALVLIVVGALVTLSGTVLTFGWRPAVLVAGLLVLAAGVDLARPDQTRPVE